MHEVSFQDKEKEHLTRLQDAEEMKVRAPPLPPSPACVWPGFSCSRKICLIQRCVWQCRRVGGGADARQSELVSECGLAEK